MEKEYYILDSEGRRKGPFRYSMRRDWSSSDPELLQKVDEREGTLSAEEEERHKKLEDETWDSGLYTEEDTNQDGKYDDPSLDAMMWGMGTPDLLPEPTVKLEEHWGLDSQGLRTVRYFTGPPPPQVDLSHRWEKGEEVIPSTLNVSQAVPLFASIEAA